MNLAEFIASFDAQPVFQANGQRAPHKALALLYALGKLSHDQNLTTYSAAESELKSLLQTFGPPRRFAHAEQPIWRLRNAAPGHPTIWQITNEDKIQLVGNASSPDPSVTDMRRYLSFGLSADAVRLFRAYPSLIASTAAYIADSVVPETLRDELLQAVGIANSGPAVQASLTPASMTLTPHAHALVSRRVRDPSFAPRVRAAYGERCAVCSARPMLGNRLFGLEAAHIRWIQADGPNSVCNGICLCRMHHVAFDRGAFTIGPDRIVKVSMLLDRSPKSEQLFWEHHGSKIAEPTRSIDYPAAEACEWHRREVFQAE